MQFSSGYRARSSYKLIGYYYDNFGNTSLQEYKSIKWCNLVVNMSISHYISLVKIV